MTANELIRLLNNKYGVGQKWPDTFEVDHETYANVCQFLFEQRYQSGMFWDVVLDGEQKSVIEMITLAVGADHRGIMFKNVELILRQKGE